MKDEEGSNIKKHIINKEEIIYGFGIIQRRR